MTSPAGPEYWHPTFTELTGEWTVVASADDQLRPLAQKAFETILCCSGAIGVIIALLAISTAKPAGLLLALGLMLGFVALAFVVRWWGRVGLYVSTKGVRAVRFGRADAFSWSDVQFAIDRLPRWRGKTPNQEWEAVTVSDSTGRSVALPFYQRPISGRSTYLGSGADSDGSVRRARYREATSFEGLVDQLTTMASHLG